MTFSERTKLFMEWIRHQQLVEISPKIRIADLRANNQGRGIVAVGDIHEGEELFTIPFSTILTAQDSSFHAHNVGRLQGLPAWAKLVLVMIYEYGKGSQSFWSAYLDILPETFDTLMHWSDPELAELRGSAVLQKIGRESADELFASQLWPIVTERMQDFGQYRDTFEREDGQNSFRRMCHRMASLIFSYGFDLDPDMDSNEEEEILDPHEAEDEPQKGLIPLADLLNADGELNNAHLIQNKTSVTMVALKSIKTDEQVYNDFGDLPRSDLLRHYGYITDRYKKWDVVEVPLSLIKSNCQSIGGARKLSEAYHDDRLALAKAWDVLDDSYDLTWPETSRTGSELPGDLLLLVKALSEDDSVFINDTSNSSQPSRTITDEEMLRLSQIWESVLAEHLQQYPTTIAADRDLLRSHLGYRHRMAVEVRMGEKEILAQWLQILRKTSERTSQNAQSQADGSHAQQSKKTRR